MSENEQQLNLNRTLNDFSNAMKEDGTIKSWRLRGAHYEKPYEKRNRKKGESAIRMTNRRVGSMLDFIQKRRKA